MASLQSNIKTALKKNLAPGLALQTLALSIALCYFYVPSTEWIFIALGDLKSSLSWKYAMISTALFGGIIPFIYLKMSGQITGNPTKVFLFYALFWAYKGIEIDYLYALQAQWFGEGNTAPILAKKVIVDQFAYGPLWAAPSMAIAFLWMESNFNLKLWLTRLDRELWFIQIPTTFVTNCLIWLPAVTIIYAMPTQLQIPLFNLVLCFFVLLLSAISVRKQP
ncbi:hypothetical protein [Reinekea sp.]|jgi:hypothetical protein|uniref:hypothetical protein n=1 Tax=Reinekea sp. TaxID=1970455 RepID=UPI00398A33A5